MPQRSFLIRDGDKLRDLGFVYACSGYLVEGKKVLLVNHKGWDKWVPPGGHLEPGETFSQAAEREFEEETGLKVQAISSQPLVNPNDDRAVADPVPFYIDVEHDFKPNPAIVQFFWVRRREESRDQLHSAQLKEVRDVDWFDAEQLKTLPTFEQVRRLATYAIDHHPDAH